MMFIFQNMKKNNNKENTIYFKFNCNTIVGSRLRVGIKNFGDPVHRGAESEFFKLKN